MTRIDNFKLYNKKRYCGGVYKVEQLELIIDEFDNPYGYLTVIDDYSEYFKLYLTKRDIGILNDLKPEEALNKIYHWILQGKIHKIRIAHAAGRYWEKDFPTPKDLAIMAKYRRLNRY